MHLNDETTGHVPADLAPEIDNSDLSDEALDRASGAAEACSGPWQCWAPAKEPAVVA
jgi:hypothetical protein